MVKRMEKRSARLLAFILALIMIGSVLAYAFRNPSKPEEREIKFDMGDSWKDWLKYLPNTTGYVVFCNLTEENQTLKKFVLNSTIQIAKQNPYAFSRWLQPNPLIYAKKILVFDIYNYLFDYEKLKIGYSYKFKEDYKGFTLKTGVIGGRYYTLVSETHPAIFAIPQYAKGVVDIIAGNGSSLADEYGNYTNRINGSFSYAVILAGNTAMQTIQSNNTPVADFYFEGYRMNGSVFEKVVGMHFLGNYFFVKTNETTNRTVYYYYNNYDDGFSLAVMGSYNLTDLIELQPEIRSIIIKFGNTTS